MNYRIISIVAILVASVFGTLYLQPLIVASMAPATPSAQEHRTTYYNRGNGASYAVPLIYGAILPSASDTWDAWWVVNNSKPSTIVGIYLTRPALAQAWMEGGVLSYLTDLSDQTALFVRRTDYGVSDLCVVFTSNDGGNLYVDFYSVVTEWY